MREFYQEDPGVIGAPNRDESNRKYLLSEKRIWVSDTECVLLGLVRNTDDNIEYIAVYCPHREWLFWNWTPWAGRYYDICINVAAAFAGVLVLPDWFEERVKSVKVVITDKMCLRDADTTRKLEKLNRTLCHPDALPVSVKYFAVESGLSDEKLKSEYSGNRSVAELMYQLIRARLPTQSSWNSGVRMPRNLPRNMPSHESPVLSSSAQDPPSLLAI